jgi:large subunit ribosomal protein L10
MPRPEKTAVVEEIRNKLSESDAAVLTEYRGLSVGALAELRSSLRPANTEYKVFKITLARRAAEAAGLKDLLPMLEGPVAFAFVRGDAVLAAKALKDFGRTNPALVVKGGLMGPRLLTAAEISELAEVAPRDVLLAQIAGAFQAPLTKAAGLFQAFTRNFAYGLQAYIDQKAQTEPAPAEEPAPPTADESEPEARAAAAEAEAPAAEEPEAPAAEEPEAPTEESSTEGSNNQESE